MIIRVANNPQSGWCDFLNNETKNKIISFILFLLIF